jgi:predicted dinucleotide-binding enzyme
MLTVPYSAHVDTLVRSHAAQGKLVIDATVPLQPENDYDQRAQLHRKPSILG